METPPPAPGSTLQRYLRPRYLIVGLVVAVVIGLLIKGLLTPAPAAVTTKQGTPLPAAPLSGHYAPPITVVDLSGNKVALSSLRGKVVALNFWYAACEPCKIEMPALQHSYDKYKSQGFVVLGVDMADDVATTNAFVREVGITYPVVRDQSLQTVTAYNVTDTPSTFFIDREGVIRAHDAGALDLSTLDTTITALLK
jgi:cytochrome c biogenesis protein CcmG, thiol:disulfide interchange protein DsbE